MEKFCCVSSGSKSKLEYVLLSRGRARSGFLSGIVRETRMLTHLQEW